MQSQHLKTSGLNAYCWRGKEEGLAELWGETGKKVTADIDTAHICASNTDI